jgi:hypothetical protein
MSPGLSPVSGRGGPTVQTRTQRERGLRTNAGVAASARSLVLTVAVISKRSFITLVLVFGLEYLGHQVGIAVVVDSMWVLQPAAAGATMSRGGRPGPHARARRDPDGSPGASRAS